VARQWDKRHVTAGSKLVVSSPACGYQLAPDDENLHQFSESRRDASERIKLQSYDSRAERQQGHSNDIQETSYILIERPPVEGRDSLTKDKLDSEAKPKQQQQQQQHVNDDFQSAVYIPPSRSNVATVRELTRGGCTRPDVEPLPLLQHGHAAADLDSPDSSHDMSPFTKTHLFTDDRTQSPLSDIVADDANVDLEYDDYLPQLPGSYFTMDPQAYTLTWSKQPQAWTHEPDLTRTASDASVDRNIVKADQC